MKSFWFIFVIGMLSASALIAGYRASAINTISNEAIVRKFEAAFNNHDVAAMIALVAVNAQWLSLNGDKLAVETNGKAELEKWLKGYFQSCPSCRSEFEALMVAGSYVTVHEKAMWESKSGPKVQRSLGVYELRDGLIQRAWYYPAEK
jgi:hypothetical protein